MGCTFYLSLTLKKDEDLSYHQTLIKANYFFFKLQACTTKPYKN